MSMEDENVKAFLRAIESTGINAEDAALGVGLSPVVVSRWLEEGRLEEEHITNGGRARKRAVFQLELWREYRKARAKAKSRILALMQEHAREDWRAAKQAMDYMNASDARTTREDPAYYMGGSK